MTWRRGDGASVAALATLVLVTSCRGGPPADTLPLPAIEPVLDRAPARGRLLVGVYGAGPEETQPLRHLWSWVNGDAYTGMEDNDLRGFLDGTFKWGWNAPGQIHVRIGRRGAAPIYGEHELFRVLQRWDGLDLPAGARVHEAKLALWVEEPPPFPVRLVIYEVRPDWDPGRGGVNHDSVSPPAPGEVWWKEIAFGVQPWGLPGAGFASDLHPEADTPEMPLAEVTVAPDSERLELSGERFTDYLARRVAAGAPLLLLLKLSDHQEEIPGTVLALYSGSHGDSRNLAFRPRLTASWSSPTQVASLDREVWLEHGRRWVGPRIAAPGRTVAASFLPVEGALAPLLELRGGSGDGPPGEWMRLARGVEIPESWDWIEPRVIAAVDPVWLGEPFTAELRDAWIRTAPPEEQRVPWVFVAPSGARYEVEADYVGEWRWRVEFVPPELGPWRYAWAQRFVEEPFQSAVGEFDVLAREREAVLVALDRLAGRIVEDGDEPDEQARRAFMIQLARLERAALAFETPETYRQGTELGERINAVRAALGEEPPDPQPFEPSPPPEWAAESGARPVAPAGAGG